jgi:hypothetical protein
MELEVKHLAPYLPYGLKLQYLVREKVEQTGIMKSISHNEDETHPTRVSISAMYNEEHIWMFKPLLKPLSKLSNEELIPIGLLIRDIEKHKATYKDNIFAVGDAKAWIRTGMKPVLSLLQVQGIMEHLYSVHADIFKLIDAGLATEF